MQTFNQTTENAETTESKMLRLMIAIDVARDSVDRLRRREELEFRKMRGWQFPNAAEYREMNHHVDAVVWASIEAKSVQTAIAALNDFKRSL